MENGFTYDIPRGVRYANLSIHIPNFVLVASIIDIRKLERESAFEKGKKALRGFRYIGYEKTCEEDMEVEMHWFIDWQDLGKCKSYWSDDETITNDTDTER